MNTLKTINPYTKTLLNEFSYEQWPEVANKTEKAQQTFQTWKKIPIRDKIAAILEALNYFDIHQETIAKDITLQMGKPISQSRNEVKSFFERAHYLCSIAEEALKPDILPKAGFHREIRHEPHGVVFVISAWNYPLLVTVNSVVAGLLAGNTILLKPSSVTPTIGQHFENAFKQMAGIDHLLQNLILDHPTTNKLLEEGNIQHVVFTGSVAGGHSVYQHAAKRFIDCGLELGGKDGAYVAEDADPADAAAGLVDGALYNAGQSCCGIERIYVHKKLYEPFIEQALNLLKEYRMGDPLLTDTTLGPLAKPKSYALLEQQVQEAVQKGAKLVYGGKRQDQFFLPTLLTSVDHTMEVMREENFGPIVAVMRVEDDREAFKLVADSHYGLTAAIYTESLQRAEAFSQAVDAGTIFMNRCDYLDPALPWTGFKDSGKGSALSKYGFYSLTKLKAIHFKLG